MDYFLMNECIFKEIIKNKKDFIIKLLNSMNIYINEYELFELDIESKEMKVDILLFSKDKLINIELNKNKKSLKRNKIYLDTLKKLLPNHNIIQININLFEKVNNEYLSFIKSKNYNNFKTKDPYILDIIIFLNKLDKNKLTNKIKKEAKIKEKLDNLITD